MTTAYGILLIGGGRTHQENYAAGFAADPRCKLIGLTDEANLPAERQRWNRELAEALNVPLLADLEAAISRDDVDAVCVCCEPERRARVAALAAERDKHVYADKPLGGNLLDIDRLVAAVQCSKVKSHMFSLLRTPWAARARRLVESGSLGDLRAIHMDLLFAKGPAGSVGELQPRREHYPPRRFTFVDSKREVFTTAIYSLAFLLWLTRSRFVEVRATTANYFFAEHLRNDVEDFGCLLLTMENGVVAAVTAGRIGWSAHPAFGPMQTTLIGSRSQAKIDAYRPRLETSDDSPPWRQPDDIPGDPMGFWSSTQAAAAVEPKRSWATVSPEESQSDQSYFLDCLEKGEESDLPISLAAHATETVFAAYQSAAERREVRLPLDRTAWGRV